MNLSRRLVGPVVALVLSLVPELASAQNAPGIQRPLTVCPGMAQGDFCTWWAAQQAAGNQPSASLGAPPAVPPPPPPPPARPSAAEQARLDAACVAACPSEVPTCPCACTRTNLGPQGTCVSTASAIASLSAVVNDQERRLETLERRAGIAPGAMVAAVVVTRPRRPAVAPAAAPRAPRPHRERHHRHH